MLSELLFPTGLLLASLLFVFHGLVLLIAPDKYVPTSAWGQTTVKLARKPPIQFGKRFAGFCLTVAILWLFTVPAISSILRALSTPGAARSVPLEGTRWALLAVGIGAVSAGYFMIVWPKRWVEALFAMDKNKLQDVATQRIWTVYIQVAGLYLTVFSLLTFTDFVRTLR
jgi:hypothetical protein